MVLTLLQIVLNLISNGIEIIMFFLLVRLILQWRSTRWLRAFDDAGKGLVDPTIQLLGKITYRFGKRHLTLKSQLLLALLLLELCHTILIQACQSI